MIATSKEFLEEVVMKINSFDKTDASEMGHVLLQDGGGNDYYAYDSIGAATGMIIIMTTMTTITKITTTPRRLVQD